MIFDLALMVKHCAYKVSVNTMLAIIKTESGGNPLAININGRVKLKYQAHSLSQATQWVDYLEGHNYNFDIGLMQVNIKNVHKYGFHASDMLDSCRNLLIGSKILHKNYINVLAITPNKSDALYKAISAYNTGNYHAGMDNGYVMKVVHNALMSSSYLIR